MSEYYTIDELNVDMEKTPDNILILHINTVSLDKNYSSIKNLLATLKPIPSIICLSETKIPLKPTDLLLTRLDLMDFINLC